MDVNEHERLTKNTQRDTNESKGLGFVLLLYV
jgi:hypothetical protein